jgi:hypothetical protein
MTVTRRLLACFGVALPATLAAACGNQTARAPNPTAYDWPDSLTYRVELVVQSDGDAVAVDRFRETKRLSLAVRNDRYLVWNDGLERIGMAGGSAPLSRRLWPEDTLHYYVRLSRLGEIVESEPGCDPVVPECRAALPSVLPLEMRHIIPRLPVWWPPRGHQWVDTLAFDDRLRARGSRGALITYYRSARDTVVSGRGYWTVTWSSVTRAVRETASGAAIAAAPVEERGVVYVDKTRLVPACAVWWGEAAASPPRAPGAVQTRLAGRAHLAGSACQSLGAGQ